MENRFIVEPVQREKTVVYYLKDRKTQRLSISCYMTEKAANEMCKKKNERYIEE